VAALGESKIVSLLWVEIGQPCSRISLYRYWINQIDSKDYVLIGLPGGSLQESSSSAVYMHIMHSPFLLHPQSTPSQVTHMVIISVSRIQILAAGVTLHSIIRIKIFISGILNLKIHHSASQHIATLHHDMRRM